MVNQQTNHNLQNRFNSKVTKNGQKPDTNFSQKDQFFLQHKKNSQMKISPAFNEIFHNQKKKKNTCIFKFKKKDDITQLLKYPHQYKDRIHYRI